MLAAHVRSAPILVAAGAAAAPLARAAEQRGFEWRIQLRLMDAESSTSRGAR